MIGRVNIVEEREISRAVIRRLPRYYRYLGELLENGVERISSNDLSKRMKVTASQIRQDLNNFGGFGPVSYTHLLKDVNELFYDTGIGKEGYSIIGQGQIDKILSGKPDERRELFDEAAGIVKFKRRKSMSVKKLEDERQNLVRVNDILSELEKQVGPLERQSEKAREYLKRKEELKTYDINMFLLEMERIRDQIRNLDEKLRITKGELEEATRKYADTKTEYESIEEQVEVIDDCLLYTSRCV